jgi:hypothetical protein
LLAWSFIPQEELSDHRSWGRRTIRPKSWRHLSHRQPAIRAVYEQRGEFAAAIELRQRFPGITDNAQARECARTIAGWKPLPLPLRPVKRMPKALVKQDAAAK